MKLDVIIATDCGSTTTKAILIEKVDGVYRQTYRGEAPTTVEAPFEDVTRGVLNAIGEVEELSGRCILDGEKFITPAGEKDGVDIYISTSSAGGGLQLMVAGSVKAMTAESAQRCALGAGAIVMDVLAQNDGRAGHEKIERIRQLRPDMILLSGGMDGGGGTAIKHPVELAEYIAAADPKPRLGGGYHLPVIFAGNTAAQGEIKRILGEKSSLTLTENLRPTMERENLMPARHKIHDLFLEHVMAQAPGYGKLMSWTGADIMPTPMAVGNIMQSIAQQRGINLIGVDIGGATTDVFSVFDGIFNRSVSANLGMSYSISNVLAEAQLPNIMRWVPFELDEEELRNRIKNKMIRPTTIPQSLEELQIEQAICREALRLALDQHKNLAVGLKGVQQARSIADAFSQEASGQSLIDMLKLDLVVGSGGVLSHAPLRVQSMVMMIDAYQPLGITTLAVDSIFMMPHLGVLASINEQAATQVFERDCMIYLGSCVAPFGPAKSGEPLLEYVLAQPAGERRGELRLGEIKRIPLDGEAEVPIELKPARRIDVGAGPGKPLQGRVRGGVVGLILDGRGRPLTLPQDRAARVRTIEAWNAETGMYSG